MATLWEIILGISVVAGAFASILIVCDHFRPIWLQPRWLITIRQMVRRGRNVQRDLESLVSFLGRVQGWLSSIDSELISDIRRDLCRVQWKVRIEALSHIALKSKDEEERALAIRNLSQVEDVKSIDHAVGVLRDVLDTQVPRASKQLRDLATAALNEIEEMRAAREETSEKR
jgi:hypothetical protein